MTRALVIAAALACAGSAAAYAHPVLLANDLALPEQTTPAPAGDHAMFGFRLGLGALPIEHTTAITPSVGLAVEHPFAHRWSLFGEYEWIWILRKKTEQMPADRGDGQRVQVGIRHRFHEKPWYEMAWFVDGELGGGFMLANDNMVGVLSVPDVFAGVRLGYDLHSPNGHRSPSRSFAPELLARAIATPQGVGMLFGIGALWQ